MSELWAGLLCAAAVPLSTGVLLLLSRREPVPRLPDGEDRPPLLRTGAFLYRITRTAGTGRRAGAAADLALLYPSRRAEGRAEIYEIRKICHILCILLLGSLLAGAAVLQSLWRDRTLEQETFRLERDAYGGTGREEILTARVGDSEAIDVPVTVSARRYTPVQMDALAEKLTEELGRVLLGDNGTADRITRDVAAVNDVEGYPFRIRWESDAPEVLSDEGMIMGREELAGGREVNFTAILTAEDSSGVRSYEAVYRLVVFPPEEDPQSLLQRQLAALLEARDRDTRDSPYLELPQEMGADERPIRWSEAGDGSAVLLFLTALLAAAAYAPLSDRKLHREALLRERQLREDYPVLVSRLAMYLGAGMSLRNIFIKLGDDYRDGRLRGEKERYLGEEILLLNREVESGVPEAEAYVHFGSRCRGSMYARLSSLLAQNLRKGNRTLLSVLHREAGEAYRERRITAKVRGEEAETKLLVPMVMMLAVTMLIIMIPAYLSFTV